MTVAATESTDISDFKVEHPTVSLGQRRLGEAVRENVVRDEPWWNNDGIAQEN